MPAQRPRRHRADARPREQDILLRGAAPRRDALARRRLRRAIRTIARPSAIGLAGALALVGTALAELPPDKPAGAIRIAVFNAALNRSGAGVLLADIRERDPQVMAVAEIVLAARPDVLVVNELDRDGEGAALDAFAGLLADGAGGRPGLAYPHRVQPMSNTGRPSGLDGDGDGRVGGPADAWGYGRFPGQYALAVLSRLPLGEPRTWRLFPWSALPDAARPVLPNGEPLHDDATWARLRLSSKTHLALPVEPPGGGGFTLVAAHPTPPVFDGAADRNGRRNADEIRLIAAILDGADWLVDDEGRTGGLAPGEPFVVAGDLNADPADGEARREGLSALLDHPRITDPRPASRGAIAAAEAQGGANAGHATPAERDTADFRDDPAPGNLRVDYLLPSTGFRVLGAGVVWPAPGTPGAGLVGRSGGEPVSSDHRLVWIDVAPSGEE
ncbi:MAG: endonuclease/exonuclease/phosphatase family protein [Paracoccaceae bacterium]